MIENKRKTNRNIVGFIILFVNSIFLMAFVLWSIQYFGQDNRKIVRRQASLQTTNWIEPLENYIHKDDKVALILDFDGVLAPLSDVPELTQIIPASKSVLQTLTAYSNVFIAIISGRGIKDLKNRVGIENITYAGNHGLEIQYDNKETYLHNISDEINKNFTKLLKVLNTTFANDGAYVENKVLSLTFHYPKDQKEIYEEKTKEIINTIRSYGYHATSGYFAIEASPPVSWTKGEAALLILNTRFGQDWDNKIKTIFIGDDDSDENAMKVLKGRAMSLKIFNAKGTETYADHVLESINNIAPILNWIKNTLSSLE